MIILVFEIWNGIIKVFLSHDNIMVIIIFLNRYTQVIKHEVQVYIINIKLIKDNDLKVALSKYYLQNDWWEQFGQRAKDTYWDLMREEMFKTVDPFMMKAFYEAEYYPNEEPVVKYEDIEVDFENIGTNKSLKNAIKRVLSLRVWHKHVLDEAEEEINKILNILKK